MAARIVARQPNESETDFHLRLASALDARAKELLLTGRDPSTASEMAVRYRAMATRRADAANTLHAGER